MRRVRWLAAALVLVSATASACAAQQGAAGVPARPTAAEVRSRLSTDSATAAALASRFPREDPDTIRAYPLRELSAGIYAVLGDSGRGVEGRPNAGFVVTRDGVVVIDALADPAEGRALLRTIRTVTALPVKWLILTHHHPDHAFGAIVFRRLGARVIAHPDRRMLVNENGDDEMVSDWTGAMGLRAMQGFRLADTPDIPVTGDTIFRLGGRAIRVIHPGAAHTRGDLMIWVPSARVLFAGDILVEDGGTMVVDGNSTALLHALDTITALHPRVAVPGHGRLPRDPEALVQRTRCYMLALRASMRAAVQSDVPMSVALERFPPADANRPLSRASRDRRNAVRVYGEMEQAVMAGHASDPANAAARAACERPGAGAAGDRTHGAPPAALRGW